MIKISHILFNFLPFLAITLFSSCDVGEEGSECSVCGNPDKAYYVSIVDTLERPVSDLDITVKDGCGNILYVPQNSISKSIGRYTLVDDELLDLQSILLNCNNKIYFSATNGSQTLDTSFTFKVGTDGLCYCEYPLISIEYFRDTPTLVFK